MPADLILTVAVQGILTGLVYGLMALGLSVIFGVVRVVNFAHGEMMTIASYAAIVAFSAWNIDPLISMIPIAVLLFALGYAMQSVLINPFINRPEHSQFILLAAVAIIMVNGLLMIFGPDARNVLVDYALDSIEVGPLLIDKVRVITAVLALVITSGLFAFFKLSRTGKAIRACADNHLGALVIGLNIKHLYALTFGIGSAIVGAAGAMMTLLIDTTPNIGPVFTLQAFVIVIIGGLGSMPGALLGGVLIGLSEAMSGLFFAPSAKTMFGVAILILVLLFRPQGLLGRKA
ncbi:branched-chain amino acid ABC transporter permease [Ferrovibrio terrae]|uniref:Branched-chain amino acid ABC transporter permease n=1 Tax=Ferrovibrio terrae TaxID=2594003 RepID=A0A516H1Y7_9PROT|nr:branched-chain amino acid ABC transporter permease [Ferrovibrio terrae]QDO97765.1 branched-chain amino acid ABC transporter permease [Ferrovibrio terrae]